MRQAGVIHHNRRRRTCWSVFLLFALCTLLHVAPAPCANAVSSEPMEGGTLRHPAAALHPAYAAEAYDVCPVFSFPLFLASAMGAWSSTRALATCTSTRFSTILDDVELTRRSSASAAALTSSLRRLTRGNVAALAYYDNAHEFLSLRAEMEAWVRANRTVGMSPSAYEAVLRGVTAVLGLNHSLLNKPVVELPTGLPSPAHGGSVNWTARIEQCSSSEHHAGSYSVNSRSTCVHRVAQEAYRYHANISLSSAAATLLVTNATFTQAQRYYKQVVFPGIIVRAFDLDPDTTTYGFDRNMRDLLRGVQHLWDTVVDEVEGRDDGVEAVSPPFTPYLPLIRERDFTGPVVRETRTVAHPHPTYPSPSRHSGTRLQALRRILPAAVLYQTGATCTNCHIFDRAFAVLPAVYKRICSRGYRSIVSCSPITLFLRTTHVRSFQLLPAMEMYARLAYSRAAVLRVADLEFRHDTYDDDDEDNEEEEEEGVASNTEERAGEDDDDGEDGDDDARGSLFYSLRVKYGRWNSGMEDEVRPRTQFRPHRVPLRLQPDVNTVEEAVVSVVSELVGSGVIQFLFLDPGEVSQIARENERVRRIVAEQLEKQQKHSNQSEDEGARETNSTDAREAAKEARSEASATAPTPNPEDHPQYRKLVSFRDLATQLVATHTRAIFGEVGHERNYRGHRLDRGSVSGSWPSSSSAAAQSWWLWWLSPSWVLRLPRVVWDVLFCGIERPLYVTAFVLLCLCQRRWNRSQQVSYW